MRLSRTLLACFTLAFACIGTPALGQQSERFGEFELHYSVVNTTFLEPEVASAYGIKRGKRTAIINLSLQKHEDGAVTTTATPMKLQGTTSDLMQRQQVLEFREIREGDAIYYIASFKFITEDWHHFDIDFLPEGAERSLSFSFKQQMYID
jgi:hypothetical protein